MHNRVLSILSLALDVACAHRIGQTAAKRGLLLDLAGEVSAVGEDTPLVGLTDRAADALTARARAIR